MTSQYHHLLPEYFLCDQSVPYVTFESRILSAIIEGERKCIAMREKTADSVCAVLQVTGMLCL